MSSPSPGLFFPDMGNSSDKKKNTKAVENPLLSRPPPALRNENAIVVHQSSLTDSGLRQRRPLNEHQPNTTGPALPPKASMSLGMARSMIAIDKPQAPVGLRIEFLA